MTPAPRAHPMAHLLPIEARERKLPVVPSVEDVRRLLDTPATDTVRGPRDQAMPSLLYGTGIRAGECGGLREEEVDLDERTIRAK